MDTAISSGYVSSGGAPELVYLLLLSPGSSPINLYGCGVVGSTTLLTLVQISLYTNNDLYTCVSGNNP